jgi:hypothetical protein
LPDAIIKGTRGNPAAGPRSSLECIHTNNSAPIYFLGRGAMRYDGSFERVGDEIIAEALPLIVQTLSAS